MSERQRDACPECGTPDVLLAPKTGLLYKHPGPDGKTCPGSGQKPATPQQQVAPEDLPVVPLTAAPPMAEEPVTEPVGETVADESDEDDWLTDDESAPQAPNAVSDPDDEPAPEPPAPAASPSVGAGEFTWQITVRQPALYLDDQAWHFENGLAAAKAAQAAGHTPAGEARCTGVAASEDGAGLVLTYTIPTEGALRG